MAAPPDCEVLEMLDFACLNRCAAAPPLLFDSVDPDPKRPASALNHRAFHPRRPAERTCAIV
jgi:hypothetical protein